MLYTIVLLDSADCVLSVTEENTLKEAKKVAVVRLAEKEFLEAGAYKVEVRDSKNVNVWDKFAPLKE